MTNSLILIFFGIILSYIFGSFPTSILTGQLIKKIDIREHGSGNAGATNVFRVLGWKPALFVIIIDIFKGWFPTYFFSSYIYLNPTLDLGFLKIIFGFSSVLGHSYTIFAGFKGGKGIGTLLGMLIALFPIAIPLCLIVFILSLIITGYVSVGSIFASIFLPIFLLISPLFGTTPPDFSLIIFSLFIPFFVIFTHRSNISRLKTGDENQFKKIMIFKKFN